jgi:hypothetical protein
MLLLTAILIKAVKLGLVLLSIGDLEDTNPAVGKVFLLALASKQLAERHLMDFVDVASDFE